MRNKASQILALGLIRPCGAPHRRIEPGAASRAVRQLELHGSPAAADIARGVLLAWRSLALDRLGPHGVDAVERLALRELARATA
ncbi:MAG: hypothetical protein HY744_32255 [Deltaproteobacteria bacterium]|nr:hypothetical protein [Deltaproteobacteria bacterium]